MSETKGYFGIGCLNMKNEYNYGSLFRTADIFGASFIFFIGSRFKKQSSDVTKSWRNIPLFVYKDMLDFNTHRPFDCRLVGIEMLDAAQPIQTYQHPKKAAYLLGSEDIGLTREAVSYCQDVIYLPGERSLNVAVAGSIVLYDRILKKG